LVECCSPFLFSVLWFLVGWVLLTFFVKPTKINYK
jgi:hypothetical protein